MPDKPTNRIVRVLVNREAVADLLGRILARHWLRHRSPNGGLPPADRDGPAAGPAAEAHAQFDFRRNDV
jgi:hypothetical protein